LDGLGFDLAGHVEGFVRGGHLDLRHPTEIAVVDVEVTDVVYEVDN
jgi:hypothetical protein